MTGVDKVPSHSLPSTKRRISNLVNENSNVGQLLSKLLYYRMEEIQLDLISAINDSLQLLNLKDADSSEFKIANSIFKVSRSTIIALRKFHLISLK